MLENSKIDVHLISLLQRQRLQKNIVKVKQTMSFSQVFSKWVETMSNLKSHSYRKREQVASYNKQKDELKTGEALYPCRLYRKLQ